jgi:hypothetical protein
MLAAMLAYTHLAPLEYEGEPYLALNFDAEITSTVGCAATLWVMAYLAFAVWRSRGERLVTANPRPGLQVHAGEWWVVLANAVAFGSSYALGASNASFLLVLAVHHEVQYLYFAYAMARRSENSQSVSATGLEPATKNSYSKASCNNGHALRIEAKFAASFLRWPVIGFMGAIAGGWLEFEWLAPLGIGGLFCHYWFDGRIWTRRSLQN